MTGESRAARAVDDAATTGLDVEAVFELMADSRRRAVVSILAAVGDAIEERELAEQVACREAGVSPTQLRKSTREDVAITLHHAHLPKLSDAGVVERSWKPRTVGRGRHFSAAAEVARELQDL